MKSRQHPAIPRRIWNGSALIVLVAVAIIGTFLTLRSHAATTGLLYVSPGGNNGTALQPGSKIADLNGDSKVDILDLRIIGQNWEQSNRVRSQGDLNGDGTVNIFDLQLLEQSWGQ